MIVALLTLISRLCMYILGISAYYHDSAICVLHDDKILFALQEERLSRKKGDESFPKLALISALNFLALNKKTIMGGG